MVAIIAVTMTDIAETSEKTTKRAISEATRMVKTTPVTDAMGVGAVTMGAMAITAAMAVMVTTLIRPAMTAGTAMVTTAIGAMAEAPFSAGRFLTN